MNNILEIKNLCVTYGKSMALQDVSIIVPEKKIVILIGANGAGKSTTLNSVMGFVKPASGTIYYNGNDIGSLSTSARVKEGLSLSPEGRHLFPYLTVKENLQLGTVHRKDKEQIKDDYEFVYHLFPKLKDRQKQKAGTLSGGEQQMVAIARSIMTNPVLLCLDEPSLGIAPIVIEEIGEAIKTINQERQTSILLVEQNVHLAFSVADYCYALQVGTIVAEGDVETMLKTDVVKKAYFGE